MLKKSLLAVLGFFIFVLILLSLDFRKTFLVMVEANIFFLVIALLLVFLVLFIKGLKWRYLILAQGGKLPLSKSIRFCCAGFFVSAVTPGRVGDLIRAVYIKKEIPPIAAISTVIVDRIADITILFSLAVAAIITFIFYFGIVVIPLEVLFIVLFMFAVLLLVLLKEKFARALLRPFFNMLIPEHYRGKLKLNFSSFYTALAAFRCKKEFLYFGSASIICWFISIVCAYTIVLALGISVPFYFMVLLLPVITLVELIPVSIFGIGTRDATAIFLFSFYSISAESAFAFSLLFLFIGYFVPALIGFFFFTKEPVSMNLNPKVN